jgi:hypothetical protein
MAGGVSPDDLASAFASLTAFAKRGMLTLRMGDLERELAGRTREEAANALAARRCCAFSAWLATRLWLASLPVAVVRLVPATASSSAARMGRHRGAREGRRPWPRTSRTS